MARRYDHSKEELREMILSSAFELLSQSGLKNLSMRKISSNIGYTVGTIYQFFSTQQELILEMNTHFLTQLTEFLHQRVKSKQPTEAAHECIQGYYQYACANPHAWECMTDYKISPEAELPAAYIKAINDLFEFVSRPLVPFVKDKTEAVTQAKLIWAAVHGICELGLMGKLHNQSQVDTEHFLTLFVTHYLKGLSLNNDLINNN